MSDSTLIATNTILQKTDPSCLDKIVEALETIQLQEATTTTTKSTTTTTFWKGGSTNSAKHYLPLQYIEPEGSKDFDNDEKAFLKIDAFNQVKNHHGGGSSSSSSYASPHTGKCYTGHQRDAKLNPADTALYQKQRNEQQQQDNNSATMEQELQTFEKAANEVWDSYRQLYYGSDDSVASVFVKLKNNNNNNNGAVTLEALFGITKHSTSNDQARWDSVHVVTIGPPNMTAKTCDYKIDSAVWCCLQQTQGGRRHFIDAENLKPTSTICPATTSTAATLVKETNRPGCKLMGIMTSSSLPNNNNNKDASGGSGADTSIPSAAHIENIGTLLEQIEMDFRSQLERVVMPKATEVMQGIYREPGKSATVHLMEEEDDDDDDDTENVNDNPKKSTKKKTTVGGTGMGVGKDMIGDIADSAKSKDSDKVLETVGEQQKKKEATASAAGATTDYTNMRASLKSPTVSSPKAKVGSSSFNGGTSPTPEFVNFRDKLKSPTKK
jgi:F-actin capping protein, beta subunit